MSPHYDPVLSKLVAYGEDREDARDIALRLARDAVPAPAAVEVAHVLELGQVIFERSS